MDLSYEETFCRLSKYDQIELQRGTNYKYCTEVKRPYHLSIYKGENQIIIVPLITSIGWYSVEMAWHIVISDTSDAAEIGNSVKEAFDHINNRCVDARTPREREDDSFIDVSTSCKSYKTFRKRYICCGVGLDENDTLIISKTYKIDGDNGYGGVDEGLIHLSLTSEPKVIGNAVKECFAAMELEQNRLNSKRSKKSSMIKTLCGKNVSFLIPDSSRYHDESDFHVGEVYQAYSYTRKSAIESDAHMCFTMGADFTSPIQENTLAELFSNYYGAVNSIEFKPLSNEFYDYFADIIGESYRMISFIKQIDKDEMFCCELLLHISTLRTSTISRIIKDFNALAQSCNLVN